MIAVAKCLDEFCARHLPDIRETGETDFRQLGNVIVGNELEGVGKIAHADFMTSRLIYHDKAKDDGKLIIANKETGKTVVDVDLPDLLSRVRTSEEYMYTPQEFLDRAYDYKLQFFLQDGKLKYAYITISVNALSWSQRIQFEVLNN